MRNLIILGLALLVMSCSNQPKYQITGTTGSDFQGMVYLKKYVDRSYEVIDSCMLTNGAFEFVGSVELPDMYSLWLEGQKRRKDFCLENANYSISIEDKVSTSEISGGKLQTAINGFTPKMTSIEKSERELMTQIRAIWKDSTATEQAKDKLKNEVKDLRANKVQFAKNFVTNSKDNPYSLIVLNIYIRNFLTIDELESTYQATSLEVQKTIFGIRMGQEIKNTRLSAEGQAFLDFSVPNVDGEMIKLSDVVTNNKLVFVDFWASWCGPCRASIPHLKELYGQYHSQGLEILAVSYDSDRDKWLQAIDKEDLVWLNGSNVKGWGCPTATQYAVRGIPATVLISADGTIVARNLRGKKLSDKIEELLKVEKPKS